MKYIHLTKNKQAIVDDDQMLPSGKWCITAGYAAKRINDHVIYMHRIITRAKEGEWVDHINGNKLDNRKSNLRICTPAESSRNTCKKMGVYKGVAWRPDRKKYRARIMLNKKEVFIGHFDDEIDAAKAYDKKAKEYFGDFARLNFPE